MVNRPVLNTRFFFRFIAKLSPRAKLLSAVWLLFAGLVICGIHGSSTGVTAGWWRPEKPYTGYLVDPPESLQQGASPTTVDSIHTIFMANARWVRWDEAVVATPWALSQFAHQPKFPVINTNFGNGQNMLISQHNPVWHIATLARPATWGYFLLGRQRGLSWYWWFQPFACFTALYLLMEVILRGEHWLAAFGAFWFCGSAFIVCWSQWPSHVTFFIALGCLCAYHLFASDSRKVRWLCGILLGLSLPGFLMYMYPPSQVPLAYLFLFIFAGLFIRDKLYRSFQSDWPHRTLCLGVAAIIGGGLAATFLTTCWPDLQAMSNTVYPGRRVSVGGDQTLGLMFRGMYNFVTIYNPPSALRNSTEAASFYLLFPGVFVAAALSRRLQKNLGAVGWLLILFLLSILFFIFIGVPESLARLTFMSYMPARRSDISIGLASIMLCVYVLAIQKRLQMAEPPAKRDLLPWIVGALVTVFFVVHGLRLLKATQEFPTANLMLLVALGAGLVSFYLIKGNAPIFCTLMGLCIIATTAVFNPLATSLDHLYDSELGREIARYSRLSPERPLWICYGSIQPGQFVSLAGGRSFSGVQWPPQLSFWRQLDPAGIYERNYNNFNEVGVDYLADETRIGFTNPQEGELRVQVSPANPALKSVGVRYVVLLGEAQTVVDSSKLHLLYKSSGDFFTIYEIP
jgi:hypothetical protein